MPYADVNGIHLYFQEHGLGPPLVLLHGGLLTIELSFGAVIPALAEHHRIIAIELQGHGRTADIDRPITFEYLAADVVGLLDHLGVEQTDLFEFSLGGLTTYQLLVDHQRRIRRAVVASADHRNDRGGEIHPERLPTEADFAAMRDAYAAVTPDPAHFEAFAEKTVALVHGFAGWTDDKLRAIKVPVLVLIGDTDFILVANAAQAAELLPHGSWLSYRGRPTSKSLGASWSPRSSRRSSGREPIARRNCPRRFGTSIGSACGLTPGGGRHESSMKALLGALRW